MFLNFGFIGRIAPLLEYPGPNTKAQAIALAESMKWYAEVWEDLLEAFALHLQLTPLAELEETYTRAFDMNPSSSLDLGWHLFGETYKRGSFMANLRQSLREHGIAEGTELPDHLPTVLRLLPALPVEDARDLTRDCILPALEKLRPKLEGAAPYNHLLEALELLLRTLAPAPEAAQADGHDCTCGHGDGHGHPHEHAHEPSHGHGFRGPEVNHG
ncbi:MAG: molecular chaperone TorD family protein [Holophagaceae bacterium]|nr:molecular chaperone TorD family protein [Holophagaceae bacterium]